MMKPGPVHDQSTLRSRVDLSVGFAEIGLTSQAGRNDLYNQDKDSSDEGKNVLARGKLLIVEDEYLIAQDLAYGPQREGIDILGPYSSIDSAIDVLRTTDDIGAAILDLNIGGRIAFDLAEQLAGKNIPFIFYTGYDSVIVPEKFRTVNRVRKPAEWSEIKKALFSRDVEKKPNARLIKNFSSEAPDLTSLLPRIRMRAREITANSDMAERLVERTLERAIREIGDCPVGVPMAHWLIGLLETTGIGDRNHLN
ncbi:MAG: hypothetical protein JWM58_4524 [Rhizobium sp.]|nr:hypothetical protein [Rhizobium sp.]